jgi:hypothetical protein
MKWRSVSDVAVMMLAVALAACAPAMSQEPNLPIPQAPAQESSRSSPPDTTPYVRPAIPEDTMKTLLPKPGGANTPLPSPEGSMPPVPEPRPSREAAPRPGEGPDPQPSVR